MARSMAGTLFFVAALLASAAAASPPPAARPPPAAKPTPSYCSTTFTLVTVSAEAVIKFDEEPTAGSAFSYLTQFYIPGAVEGPAGLIAGRCAFLEVVSDTDTTSVCDLTVLTYGDIGTATVNGVLRSAANSSSYISITGGTQAYRSASGQVKVAASADLSYASWSVSLDKTPSCPPGTGTTW